jgi:molecular chaperone Hsp33
MDEFLPGVRESVLTEKNISMLYVDVTGPARALEHSHLCGPCAGMVQAQALACVALIGAELSKPKETVTLRFRVSGPVAGILVENIAGGGLRGYTNNKVLNNLDSLESYDIRDILGKIGELSVVRSVPGKTLSSAIVNVDPASLQDGLTEYFTKSLQRNVILRLNTLASRSGLTHSKAVLLECMPDGDKRIFNKLARSIADGKLDEVLAHDGTFKDICVALGIKELRGKHSEALEFKCRCSFDRVARMVSGLSDADLKDMIHGEQPTRIICHMCGTGYQVSKELLWSILEKRGHDLDLGEEFDYD